MTKNVNWDVESTQYFLELLSNGFNMSRGTISSPSLYERMNYKLNERYGPNSYNVAGLRSKFQRCNSQYSVFLPYMTTTGLGSDEETQTINTPEHVILQHTNGYKKTEKLFRECIPNFHLYRKVFARSTVIGFMATPSGGPRPDNTSFLLYDSDEEEEVDFSEMSVAHSGDKRPSSSKQKSKKKKKGKAPSVNETFVNMCSMMSDRFGAQSQQVDGPKKEPNDLLTCYDILDTMGLDMNTKFKAFELLRKQDRQMQRIFLSWEPTFRQFWLTKMLGGV